MICRRSKKVIDPRKAFKTGTWHSYLLEELDTTETYTIRSIRQSLEIFSSKFKLDIDFIPHNDLILCTLILEELKGRKRRMKTRRGVEEPESNPPKVYSYKLGINMEARIIFSNKKFPIDMCKKLALAFKCKELNLLDLRYSDPFNLLLFRRQAAKYNSGELALQHEAHLAALEDEIADRALHVKELLGEQKKKVDECCRKLGSDNDLIPCIKRLDINISNQPLNTNVSNLSSYRISNVMAEVHAPSVFHLYKQFGEMGHLQEVPLWLERARYTGKNTVTGKFL
ncbi:hypothetical protein Pmani_032627 [Petrolisthes manimaculis]|uniref:Uncharacterized protein n=1 Tax=Petrolisthes manimaculis TaxID=1843537 RepID=A0AAE1NT82_9EUCA|nr:hypothetical protein Pmani_032627 [Petrolisthes manimaculis]